MNNSFIDWLNNTGLIDILPVSPVQKYLLNWSGWDTLQNVIGYLNWFLPISWVLDVMTAWLLAIGIFYAVQWFLRTIHVVGS